MKQNAIVLAGYYGFGNAGDELILAALVHRIRREDPLTSITVLSRTPEKTKTEFKVDAVNRWNPFAWIFPLANARRFWLGGGGLLQETTGRWNHLYYLGLIVLAKTLGCRTAAQAMGVDPTSRPFNRMLMRWVLNKKTDYISVRDDDSYDALRSAGVDRPVDKVRDPIFDPTASSIEAEPNRIGLSITAWATRPTWAQDIATLCDQLTENLGVTVEMFGFFPEQEDGIIQSIRAHCRHPIVYEPWKNPTELPDRIARCSMIVGMRYHALALAAVVHRPFMGWGFQGKVQSLCRQFDRPFRSFNLPWNSQQVFDEIHALHAESYRTNFPAK